VITSEARGDRIPSTKNQRQNYTCAGTENGWRKERETGLLRNGICHSPHLRVKVHQTSLLVRVVSRADRRHTESHTRQGRGETKGQDSAAE